MGLLADSGGDVGDLLEVAGEDAQLLPGVVCQQDAEVLFHAHHHACLALTQARHDSHMVPTLQTRTDSFVSPSQIAAEYRGQGWSFTFQDVPVSASPRTDVTLTWSCYAKGQITVYAASV